MDETLSKTVRNHLENIKRPINEEIRNYPLPAAGCDAQYNHLIDQRGQLSRELTRLEAIVRSDATAEIRVVEINEFINSSAFIDDEMAKGFRKITLL